MGTNKGLKCTIGKVRASYVHVFEPYAFDNKGEKKYSMAVLIPKDDKKSIDTINECVKRAYQYSGVQDKWKGTSPKEFVHPLHDGDAQKSDKPEYADCLYLNAKNSTKPGLVKKTGTKMVDGVRKNILVPITDEAEFYSGCWVYVSLGFYAYKSGLDYGVACSVDNILKVEDGEPLGGRNSAEYDFGGMDIPDDIDDDPFGDAPKDDCPFL